MNNELNIIAIDTSTAVMAGASYRDQAIATVQTEAERNHSIHILTNIERLLSESKWSVQDVSHYVVGIGPGSYTGVRIAVSAIKALAWATQKAIVSVSSLEGLAYSALELESAPTQSSVKNKTIAIIPIMDARRGQVYTARFDYEQKSDVWHRQQEDHITLMDSWVDKLIESLQESDFDEVWIVGDVKLHLNAIERLNEALSITVHAMPTVMNGAALAKLGKMYVEDAAVIYEGERVHLLAPNYAQLTEAEVKQNEKDKEAQKHG